MQFVSFPDKSVPYSVFVDDVAARLAWHLKVAKDDPEYINQSQAYKMFGRRNVERWRKAGKISLCKRPGKVEYRTADLRLLQQTQQDYFSK